MRTARKFKSVVFAAAFAATSIGTVSSALAVTCSSYSASTTFTNNNAWFTGITSVTFAAGDILTATIVGAAGGPNGLLLVNGASAATVSSPGSATYTVATAGTFNVNFGATGAGAAASGTATVTCASASSSSSTSGTNLASAAIQSVSNAQQSVSMGQTALKNLTGFTATAIASSFATTTAAQSAVARAPVANNTATVTAPSTTLTFTLGGSVVSVVNEKIVAIDGAPVGPTISLLFNRGRLVGISAGSIPGSGALRFNSGSISVRNGAILTNGGTSAFTIPANQSEIHLPGGKSRDREVAMLVSRIKDLEERAESARADTVGENSSTKAIAYELTAARRELAFARLNGVLEQSTPAQETATLTDNSPVGDGRKAPTPPPELHLNARQLIDACDATCDIPPKWNVWLDGRATGTNDTVALTNSLGFIGATGADYKITPRLALGLSLSAETSRSITGLQGSYMSAFGVSVLPYVGYKIDDNLVASAFVGVTSLNYSSTPIPGVSAQFNGTRFMTGGSLTGTWYESAWRLQPTLSGSYGTETQYGYTDSAGNVVPGQVTGFGRIEAGPEVGYTFYEVGPGVSLEPFANLRAIGTFSSATMSISSVGTPVVVRPGTVASGAAGGGVSLKASNGFFFRMSGSYESIGVTGLDIWTAVIRGGATF